MSKRADNGQFATAGFPTPVPGCRPPPRRPADGDLHQWTACSECPRTPQTAMATAAALAPSTWVASSARHRPPQSTDSADCGLRFPSVVFLTIGRG